MNPFAITITSRRSCCTELPTFAESPKSQDLTFFGNLNMNNHQYFAHRPPSHTTLLRDPWPTELPLHKTLKPRVWTRIFSGHNLTRIRPSKSASGLLA